MTERDSYALDCFKAEINSDSAFQKLAVQDERDLVATIKDPKISNDVRSEALNRLTKAHQRFILSIASTYGSHQPLGDAIQEGNIAFLRSVEKYDLQYGTRVITNAMWWVRTAVTRSGDTRPEDIDISRIEELLEQKAPSTEKEAITDAVAQRLLEIMQENLTTREVKIMLMWSFGYSDVDVGKEMCVSKQRIRALRLQSITKLKTSPHILELNLLLADLTG